MDKSVHKHRTAEEKLRKNEDSLAAIQSAPLEEVKSLQSLVAMTNSIKLEVETQSKNKEEELKPIISRLMKEKGAAENDLKKL